MPITINTKTWNLDKAEPDAQQLSGPSNTFAKKEVVRFARTMPKSTKSDLGTARSELKTTHTMDRVVGSVTTPSDVILRAASSVPVGVSDADVDVAIADFRAFVASTHFVDLVKRGKVSTGA